MHKESENMQLLGNEHSNVAHCLNNLAKLLYYQGRYTEAEPLYLQALEMLQELLGDQHPFTVKVQSNFDDCRQKIKELNA